VWWGGRPERDIDTEPDDTGKKDPRAEWGAVPQEVKKNQPRAWGGQKVAMREVSSIKSNEEKVTRSLVGGEETDLEMPRTL